MFKAYRGPSALLGLLLAATAFGEAKPAMVFPIQSLAGDSELGRSLRAFEDGDELLLFSLVQLGEPKLSFDKDEDDWVRKAMATLLEYLDPETLEIYARAADGEFHGYLESYDAVATSEALKEAIRKQNGRLEKAGQCASRPPVRPPVGLDLLRASVPQVSRGRPGGQTGDPIPDPRVPPPIDNGPETPVTTSPVTATCTMDDIQSSTGTLMGEGAPILPVPLPKPAPDSGGPVSACQLPDYVKEMPDFMRRRDLERLFGDLCWRNLVSYPSNPLAKDEFTGFLLDLPLIPHRIMGRPILSARFRIATQPSPAAKALAQGLRLPKPSNWGWISSVKPRFINRPTGLIRDQIAYAQTWVHDGDLYVDVAYAYFGTNAMRSEFSTPLQYAPIDVSARTPDEKWNLDSLGLSLRFTLGPDTFKPAF